MKLPTTTIGVDVSIPMKNSSIGIKFRLTGCFRLNLCSITDGLYPLAQVPNKLTRSLCSDKQVLSIQAPIIQPQNFLSLTLNRQIFFYRCRNKLFSLDIYHPMLLYGQSAVADIGANQFTVNLRVNSLILAGQCHQCRLWWE